MIPHDLGALHREEARLLAFVGRTVPLQGRQPGAHHGNEGRPKPLAFGSIDGLVQGQHDADPRAFLGVPGSGPGNGLIIGQTHQQDLDLVAGPTVQVLGEPPSWQQIGLAAVQLAVSIQTQRAADVAAGFLGVRPWQGQDLCYEVVEVRRLARLGVGVFHACAVAVADAHVNEPRPRDTGPREPPARPRRVHKPARLSVAHRPCDQ